MGALRILGWLYVAVYLAVGLAIGLSDAPELIGWIWIPFGCTGLVFILSAPRADAWTRVTCAVIVSAIAASAVVSTILAAVAFFDELDLLSDGVATATAWIAGGAAGLSVLVLMAAALIDRLGEPTRARGLIALAAVPTAFVIAAAAVSGLILLITPPLADVFLEGIVALASLFWCGLAAAWLAGAWIVVLRVRARLAPPPIPPAIVRR